MIKNKIITFFQVIWYVFAFWFALSLFITVAMSTYGLPIIAIIVTVYIARSMRS